MLVIENGANHDDMQFMNRLLVLSLLRKSRVTTRAEIAKTTGLKRATITNIIAEFIQRGIVTETGIIDGQKGRRSIGICLNGIDYAVVAIRLARRHFSIGLFDITGQKIESRRIPLNFIDGSEYALRLMKAEVRKMMESSRNIVAIGIALPGPYLKFENKIAQMSDFPGWENVNITKEFSDEFRIPVFAEHDGNAGTLAEWWLGNHRGGNYVLLTIIAGQGNGAGVIQNGRLFLGAHGFAGELGHTSIAYDGPQCGCGNRGCLDLYCSTIVLFRHINESLKEYPASVLHGHPVGNAAVKAAVAAADELAVTSVQKMGRYLAYGIVNAINTYDPDLIVIGDELAEIGGPVLLDEVRTEVRKRVLPSIYEKIEIKLSTLDDSILLGAMVVAVDNVFQTSLKTEGFGKQSNISE